MGRSEAEDAGGLSPVKDDNDTAAHFNRRTLPFFKFVDYMLDKRRNFLYNTQANAGVAQPVEQLIRNQQVVCSSHITSSKSF